MSRIETARSRIAGMFATLSILIAGCAGSDLPDLQFVQVETSERHLVPLTMSELQSAGETELTAEFELKNVADTAVVVHVVSTNCSCVGVISEDRRLGGREVLEIPARQSRFVALTREIPPGGGVVSAMATLQPKDHDGTPGIPLDLSVERHVVPEIRSLPLIMRETLTEADARVLTRSIEITAASRDESWLRSTNVAAMSLPAGFSIDDVQAVSDCHKLVGEIYSRSWRIAMRLDLDSLNPEGLPNVSTMLRLGVQSDNSTDRVLYKDIPVTVMDVALRAK